MGLGEDPQVLAIRAPELFGVRTSHYDKRWHETFSDTSILFHFIPVSLSLRHTRKLFTESVGDNWTAGIL